MAHPGRWLLALVILLVISGVAVCAWYFHGTLSADALEVWMANLGIWAPIVFILLYTVATVAMVPGSILDLTGGALFGPYLGSMLDLTSGSLGAALAFLTSRLYNFRKPGGSADVHFLKEISSRMRIGGALSGRANGPCPGRPGDILDPKLARRLRRQSSRRPELEHLRLLSEL